MNRTHLFRVAGLVSSLLTGALVIIYLLLSLQVVYAGQVKTFTGLPVSFSVIEKLRIDLDRLQRPINPYNCLAVFAEIQTRPGLIAPLYDTCDVLRTEKSA